MLSSTASLRILKFFEPISQEIVERKMRVRGIDPALFNHYRHPQEDYFWTSEQYPIFAVADGVTLEFVNYLAFPDPSPAKEAARIFCETFGKEAECMYPSFPEGIIKEAFCVGNRAVEEYNRMQGRTKETSDFWCHDLFATTTAVAVVKDDAVYWATICDSYVMRLGKDGNVVFQSSPCWPEREKYLPEGWDEIDEDEKKKIIRQVYRNGLDEKGERIGYGVVTGEPAAEKYLHEGKIICMSGETLLLFTDGFEEYVKLPEFLSVFREWPDNIEIWIREFCKKKAGQDVERFGHERTLIAVKFV